MGRLTQPGGQSKTPRRSSRVWVLKRSDTDLEKGPRKLFEVEGWNWGRAPGIEQRVTVSTGIDSGFSVGQRLPKTLRGDSVQLEPCSTDKKNTSERKAWTKAVCWLLSGVARIGGQIIWLPVLPFPRGQRILQVYIHSPLPHAAHLSSDFDTLPL